MSSEPSRLATVRKQLRAAIEPLVPQDWRIEPTLTAVQKLDVPGLYFEFNRITNSVDGTPIPPGHVLAEFTLLITVPLGSVQKDEDKVDAAVLDLILALDSLPDVAWDTAEKGRIAPVDQLAWSVSVAVLTTTRETATIPDSTTI